MDSWQDGWDRQHTEDRKWVQWALDQWSTFPNVGPPPLVLIGPMVWSQGGHHSGMAKLAFLNRDWQLPPSVPDRVLQLARASGGHTGPPSSDYKPLQIKSGTLDSALFETDRGPLRLPAWRLESEQAIGPMWVLDPDVASTSWAPQKTTNTLPAAQRPTQRLERATSIPGARLTVFFTSGPPEWVEYPSAEIFESDQAVVVLPVARDIGPHGFRTMPGFAREFVAKLGRPLGRRVLVNLDASAVAVLDA
jgi:hypothetical protein